ncbi:MAG: hypothetical protein JW990_05405 [Thermoleophilia bacterium]|nr:hypothetical protein [Thermoleophilia bacterium]
MCAPADFDALHTCILRVLELSTAGLATYAIHWTIRLVTAPRRETPERPEVPLAAKVTGIPAMVGDGGHTTR